MPVPPHRGGMHRILRSAVVALATLSLITCAEDPVGPAGGRGILRVVPVFDANARFSPLLLDQVRVVVERPLPAAETSDTVADVTRGFDRGRDQITIDDISIRMQQQSEDLLVTIQLLSGTTLLFAGSQTVHVVRGQRTPSTSIPVSYQGPGGNVASLVLAPQDTILSPGATLDYRLDAFDVQGAPVAQYYVHWSLVGGPATGASIDAGGRLTAPAIRDTFYVKVVSLPTNIEDSTRVIIAPSATPTVTPVPLAAGDDQSCQIKAGVTFCWGANDLGQLGDGTTTDRLVPTPVAGGHTFVAVSIGVTHTCALTATGQAFCWGNNSTGALGDGTTTDQTAPVAVSGGLTFAEIATANGFTCAVTLQGEGRCWGANFEGQLGDGTTTSSNAPVAVAGGHSFVRISAAGFFDSSTDHSCAIDGTGQGWCWGANNEGQLGNGSQTGSLVPVAVSGGLSFSDISVGGESSCAISTAGVGFCWGFNFGVQLTTPQQVAGGFTYTALDMGADHVCGRTASGWVCGGDNSSGQLGDGTTTERQTPVAPSGGHNFTTLAAGDSHTCGITATDTYCWGYNGTGQLGTGDPNLADHLTPALVVGAPASVTLNAGNGQSAPAGGSVAVPPAVLVRDAQGNPVPGAEVIFTVTSGGGTLVLGNGTTEPVLTDAAGVATVSGWTLGATAGSNGLGARVSAAGVTGNPVSFTATGTTGTIATFTWTGGTSTDWSVPGNWSPAQVPGALDSAVIGAAGRQPSLSTTTVVGAVSIVAGGNLVIKGQGLSIVRGLATGGTGVLTMTSGQDAVVVGGNAVFDGGNELNLLTAGGISIAGNLTQLASTSGDSYHPSGTHLTVFAGAAPRVSFATPGLVPGTSHFQDLAWVGTGTLTLLTPVMAHGTLVVSSATSSTIATSNGSRLTVGDLAAVAPVVFNGVPLTISQSTPGSLALNNLTFQGMPTNISQLVVSSPGAGGPFDFTNLVFSTLPVAPNGFYIEAVDTTGGVDGILTINMVTPTPASGGAFIKARNGAVVNWPTGAVRTWLGTSNDLWSVASNWSPAQVPGAADDVVIPAGTPNSLSLDVNTSIRSLTVNTGVFFNLNGFTLGVTGSVNANGQVSGGVSNSLLNLSGTGQMQGQIETNTTISGAYSLGGTLNFGQNSNALFTLGVSGSLDLAGHTANVKGGFSTSGTGVLQMILPTDSLVVTNGPSLQGRATFGGGSTTGRLTAGTLSVDGQFTQSGSGSKFAPSGTHRTVLNALVSFADPINSGFQDVDITGAAGFTAQSAVTIKGTLTAGTNPSGTSSIGGQFGPQVVTTAGVNVAALTLSGANLVIGSGPITRFDNVQFSNSLATSAALTVVHPGAATPFVFNNLQFNTTPTAPNGFYLRANDTDGGTPNILTINMVGASPTTPGAFVSLLGGAVVNWPPVAPINTWTGAAGTAWSTAGNWSLGVVPSATDSVVIPAATNQPVLTTPASVGAVTVTGGTLSLNSQTLTVARTFATTGSGTLSSNTAASLLVVAGNALFGGGDETGLLTDGNLRVAGNFTQETTANGFVATGLHTTFLNGTGAQAVTLPNGGAASSRFQNLRVANATGTVTLSGTTPLLVVNGTLTVASGATLTGATAVTAATVITSTGSTLSVSQLTVPASGLTVAGNYGVNQTILTGGGAVPVITYNNLTLTGATAFTLGGDLFPIGALTLQSDLTVGGFTVQPETDLLVSGTGRLIMTNPADQVNVGGNAFFQGGDETGRLTAGILRVAQNFTQAGGVNTFVASGTHKTILRVVATSTVSFVAPSAAASHFQDLDVAGTAALTTGDFVAVGAVRVLAAAAVTSTGIISARSVSTVTGSSLTTVTLNLTSDTLVAGGGYNVANTTFLGGSTLPVAPYQAVKLDLPAGGSMTMAGNTATTGDLLITNGNLTVGGRTLTVGGNLQTLGTGTLTMTNPADLVVVSRVTNFDGTNEAGLLTAGILRTTNQFFQNNTSSAATFVASGTHTVEIVAQNPGGGVVSFANPTVSHFQNLRVLFLSSFVSDIVVNGNLEMNFNTAANLLAQRVTVGGNYTQPGIGFFGPTRLTLLGGVNITAGTIGADTLEFAGSAPQTYPAVDKTFPQTVLIASDVTMPDATASIGADLEIQGSGLLHMGNTGAFNVAGSFRTVGNGRLEMINPSTTLSVAGGVTFSGGSETGSLTAGTINVNGNFTQSTSLNSFAADGSHLVRLVGGLAQTVSFSSPGAASSRFQDLEINKSGGAVTLGNLTASGGVRLNSATAVVGAAIVARSFASTAGSSFGPASLTLSSDTLIPGGGYTPALTVFTGGTNLPGLIYQDLVLNTPMIMFGDTRATRLTISNGPFTLGGKTMDVTGALNVVGTAAIVMTNPADLLSVAGDAIFQGGDETGRLTAGTLLVQGNFTQAGAVATSFLATGGHLTRLGSATGRTVNFASGQSHFGRLDVDPAAGGLTLLSVVTVDSSFTSTLGNKIIGGGKVLTIRSAQVNGLIVDNAQVVINENGAIHAQQFDNVTFQNLPTTGALPLSVTGVGAALAPRVLTFNSVNYPTLPTGAGNLYAKLTSSNVLGLTLRMLGSNHGIGALGDGPLLSDPINQQTIAGATILWQ